MKYELRFDDWACNNTVYSVPFREADKDGVKVEPYDYDEKGNLVAVLYYFFVVRIANGLRWQQGYIEPYTNVIKHTQLWECHEQYKKRIW